MPPRIQFSIRHLLVASIVAAVGFGVFRIYLLSFPEEQRITIAISALACLASIAVSLACIRWHSNRSRRGSGEHLFSAPFTWFTRLRFAIPAAMLAGQGMFSMWIAFGLANWVSYFNASVSGPAFALSILMLLTRKAHFYENGIVASGYFMEAVDVDLAPDQDRVRATIRLRLRFPFSVLISRNEAAELSRIWDRE